MIKTISIDVHCFRPSWVDQERHKSKYSKSAYRIFLDDASLFIERTWAWDNNKLIRENLIAELPPNTMHYLRLDTVVNNPAQAAFSLDNFKLDGEDYPYTFIDNLHLTFYT